ncbi:DMT family transporter [Metallumcola ferriviriculae]|uniref:DMT family transporter n=1 Tax=Metallumcola ferriviriculae TaxID=3039180 RepID=A0AAU0URZ9_9FIRM|nr:DMT family transporter [Desulfitibacteraceae bacterium MK1]
MNKHILGSAVVLLSASCFATAAIIIKFAYDMDLSVWQVLWFQSFMASMILAVIMYVRPRRASLSWNRFLPLMLQGVVGAFVTSLAFFMSLQFINASLASVLLYTYPVFVTLGSMLFLKKPVSLRQLLAILCTVAGTLLVLNIFSVNLTGWSTVGVLLGLLSGITYAFYNVMGEVTLSHHDPFTVTAITQFASTGALVVIRPGVTTMLFTGDVEAWFVGALLAIVTSIVPFFLLLHGIKMLGAARSAIISTFELPMTMLLSFILLEEQINEVQLIGAVLVLFGIIVLQSPSGMKSMLIRKNKQVGRY